MAESANFPDFQHVAERGEDPVVRALGALDSHPAQLPNLRQNLRTIRRHLRLSTKEWRKLRSRILLVYGYQALVERSRGKHATLLEVSVPAKVLTEMIEHLPPASGQDGITSQSVKFPRGSIVDQWVRDTYLSQAKTRYRGIVGYSAHVRYAYNSGAPQEWDDRFVSPHANFHWDQACNAFPFVVYLSDVDSDDGPFSVFLDSLNFRPNPYLAAYDRYLTDRDGVDSHHSGDLVGRYLEEVPPAGIKEFTGPPGLGVMFEGRSVVHHGGFPSSGGHRLVVFFNAKNLWMGLLDRLVRVG